ncbi:MAG: hypothetical protein M0R03_03610 [Novosphingobium sp.]|nr:hypothetical protein [Novosphingobium sp.]
MKLSWQLVPGEIKLYEVGIGEEFPSHSFDSLEALKQAFQSLPPVEEGYTRNIIPSDNPKTASIGWVIYDNGCLKPPKGVEFNISFRTAQKIPSFLQMHNEMNHIFEKYFPKVLKDLQSKKQSILDRILQLSDHIKL